MTAQLDSDSQSTMINIRVPEPLLTDLDDEWSQRGYASRSEAVRDAVRKWVTEKREVGEVLTGLNTNASVDLGKASKKRSHSE